MNLQPEMSQSNNNNNSHNNDINLHNATINNNNNQNSNFSTSNSTQSLPPTVQCSPIFVEYQLMKEYIIFQKSCLSHVYVIPSHKTQLEWFGVMFIHSGIYCGSILRFTIYISSSYPNCDVPKIIFSPVPIHPLVNQTTGQLDLACKFSKWNSNKNFISDAIKFSKSLFEFSTVDELKGCLANNVWPDTLNFDAVKLGKEISKRMVNFNDQVLKQQNDDKNFINFIVPESDHNVIDKLKRQLLSGEVSVDANHNGGGVHGHHNNAQNMFKSANNYNRGYNSSTSLTGLSWAKKIVFK